MGTKRPYNLPQAESGSDVAVGVTGENTVEVVGITTVPFLSTTPPGPSVNGYLPMMDTTGTFLKWGTATDLINFGLGGDLLNKLTVDRQGLVMLDQNGNLLYTQ